MDTREEARPAQIIGAASGWGSPDRRCAEGPAALHASAIFSRLRAEGLCDWEKTLHPAPDSESDLTPIIADFCQRLSREVIAVAASNGLPVVAGGDHSCAIGTWSGLSEMLRDRGPMGLLWIDAHMDSHTPETSLSGAIHGMALACLLGFGDRRLTQLLHPEPKLQPQHVCLIGVRSFEEAEQQLMQHLGVRVFYMEEIHRRGLPAVLAEALAIVQDGTAGFGISLDLDVIDPQDAPGVSTPAPDGIRGDELVIALKTVRSWQPLAGLEIAEYNPHLDRNQQTAHLAGEVLATILEQRR